jgi:hypothetical protein
MKNKRSTKDFFVVSFIMSLVVAVGLYVWGIVFPTMTFTADRYLFGWLLGIVILILARLDKPLFSDLIPVRRLEPISDDLFSTIGVGLIASVVAVFLLQTTSTMSFVQLFSISSPQGQLLLTVIPALLIVGYVMPFVEEDSLFGSGVRPTIEDTLRTWGFSIGTALILSFALAGILFGFGFHVIFTQISFTTAIFALVLRILLDVGNLKYGYLFGQIVHSTINSFIVGVVLFGLPLISFWFFPVVLVVLPYALFRRS